jgi:hypothetical protein
VNALHECLKVVWIEEFGSRAISKLLPEQEVHIIICEARSVLLVLGENARSAFDIPKDFVLVRPYFPVACTILLGAGYARCNGGDVDMKSILIVLVFLDAELWLSARLGTLCCYTYHYCGQSDCLPCKPTNSL